MDQYQILIRQVPNLWNCRPTLKRWGSAVTAKYWPWISKGCSYSCRSRDKNAICWPEMWSALLVLFVIIIDEECNNKELIMVVIFVIFIILASVIFIIWTLFIKLYHVESVDKLLQQTTHRLRLLWQRNTNYICQIINSKARPI